MTRRTVRACRRLEGAQRIELERALRGALQVRAAGVRSEPNLDDLRARLGTAGASRSSRSTHRIVAAAAAAVVAAAAGVAFGTVVAPARTERAVLSADGGSQGGALPTGPAGANSGETGAAGDNDPPSAAVFSPLAAVPRHLGRLLKQEVAGLTMHRTTSSGVGLSAAGAWLAPVAVVRSDQSGCYTGQVVTTAARVGTITGTSTAVAGTLPLSATGLEVLDSGVKAVSALRDLWWATVAVGPGVGKVAAEAPDGTTDITRPVGGIALVGGVVAAGEVTRFFSVVAETSTGKSLNSLGFLAGWGPRSVGAAAGRDSQDSATGGCAGTGVASRRRDRAAAAGALQAAASVEAAMHSAYGTAGVDVVEIRFLSAGEAEVVYRIAGGRLRAGALDLSSSGLWQVQ